ncbi:MULTISPECIES: hypothetical protein [Streptomyces]|uniref:Uncharacterized protein n=1 Tax=Streptomyces violaceochromogenes TaxID=67377 RepID=A0ABU6M0Y6_9ACTN|nr:MULTISPECIES: hypothetical protein [Streptomyces]MEC7055227.1 hypothetical protein [Streptomyces violaceochromogenes]GHC72041.1 hypothetical protein GCM10010309_40820 [Streptomyces violaceochromogenes]
MALLDWRSPEHFDHSGDKPCVICTKPTPLRSDRGKPVHKVCAEEWIDRHSVQEDDA